MERIPEGLPYRSADEVVGAVDLHARPLVAARTAPAGPRIDAAAATRDPIGPETLTGVAASELLTRAQEHLDRYEVRTARALAARVLAAGRTDDDRRRLRARALTIVAICDRMDDRYPEGMAAGLAAIELCRGIGDLAVEARARAAVARILLAIGETEEAVTESYSALNAAESSGDLTACMIALTTMATACISLNNLELCLEYCERAAETARMIGDELAGGTLMDTAACAYIGQAEAARTAGDEVGANALFRTAADLSHRAMLTARRHGHRRFEANALANYAEGLAAVGEQEEALRLLGSWQADPDLDAVYTITHHLDTRGGICMAMGRYAQAAEFFAAALAAAESKSAAMIYHQHLADAYERSGDLARALDNFKTFHALFEQVSSESARRSASVAAVRWETVQAKAFAEQEGVRAEALSNSNMELSRRTEHLLQQSREDPLTGLANRRAMDRLLEAGLGSRFIALVDVDHFKEVNDTFSHLVGDEVLRLLGWILRGSCRAEDTAVRYGGEEFAILLHHVDEPAARATAERVRVAVEKHDWNAVAEGLAVTVSIGVAHGTEAATVAEVLALADRRLYTAKRAGRNRVVHA